MAVKGTRQRLSPNRLSLLKLPIVETGMSYVLLLVASSARVTSGSPLSVLRHACRSLSIENKL